MPAPRNGSLSMWLLGALLALNLAMGGMLWNTATNRLDRIEDRVERVQAEYGRIPTLEQRVIQLQATMDKLFPQTR